MAFQVRVHAVVPAPWREQRHRVSILRTIYAIQFWTLNCPAFAPIMDFIANPFGRMAEVVLAAIGNTWTIVGLVDVVVN